MGVYSQRSHDIVPVNNCYIQNEECNKIANDIFEFIKQNNISVYNEKTLKGTVRHIIIRIGVRTGEILVTIVVNDNKLSKEQELVKYLIEKHPNIKSIVEAGANVLVAGSAVFRENKIKENINALNEALR